MGGRPVGIRGTGSYVPDKVLTNRDFEALVDTSDEWIVSRTGIKERRMLAPHQATSDLALEAARRALADAKMEPDEIDLVIVGTVTGDNPFPATACLVQRELGCTKAGGFDLAAACSGFLNVMVTGWQFVRSGMYDNVLCIGAESLTRIVDYEDRSSCILFGDGAGAAILSSKFERGEIRSGYLRIDGSGYDVMHIPVGGTRAPMSRDSIETRQHYMRIRGREVYKFAVSRMVELIEREREQNSDLELGWVVPHQVNLRIIESARERLGLDPAKIFVNIDKYGNTSAASIPIAFDELVRSGGLEGCEGKQIIFCAFGAGLTWASASLKW